jgi:hypothetical protein
MYNVTVEFVGERKTKCNYDKALVKLSIMIGIFWNLCNTVTRRYFETVDRIIRSTTIKVKLSLCLTN